MASIDEQQFDIINDNFDKIMDALSDIKLEEEYQKKFQSTISTSEESEEKETNPSEGSSEDKKRRCRNRSRQKPSKNSKIPAVREDPTKITDSEKQRIKNWTREWMWIDLEKKNRSLHVYPRPVFGKTPNFLNTKSAAINLTNIQEYKHAKVIYVQSAMSLMPFRELVLMSKELMYSNVRDLLFEDFMFCIRSRDLKTKKDVGVASTKKGLIKYGKPIRVGFKSEVKKIDMIVLGSVAVTENGVRLGIGKGISDLIWGMLYDIGAVDQDTLVVTIVADDQVLDDKFLPQKTRFIYDVPVDIICTPTRVCRVKNRLRKPTIGISSRFIYPELLERVPALKNFHF